MTYTAVPLAGTNNVVQFITVTLLFVLVLGLTYFTTRFVGGYQKNKLSGTNIKVLETMRVANNKFVSLIKVGDKVFAVALCKDTVTMLGEVDEASLTIEESADTAPSFDEIFKKFKHGR